jgi:copper chaperone
VVTFSYTVPGMSCEHCVSAIRDAVATIPGVDAVSVDLETKHVEVSGSPLDDVVIRAAIEDAGYEAS